jgi:hypothetical protein
VKSLSKLPRKARSVTVLGAGLAASAALVYLGATELLSAPTSVATPTMCAVAPQVYQTSVCQQSAVASGGNHAGQSALLPAAGQAAEPPASGPSTLPK